MNSGRLAPRIVIVVAILTMVAAVIGFVATLVMNAFVFDKYNAYGEVPIPGQSSLHLPEGEVTISFHTNVTGSPSGGFPIPHLEMTIVPPEGVPDPVVTESMGGTTTVNSDTRVRVWVAQIPAEGTYDIVTDGDVNGYISPQLAFGHGSEYGWLVWLFGGLFALSVVELVAGLIWSAKIGKRPRPLAPQELLTFGAPTWNSGEPAPSYPPSTYPPTDKGIRLEQLKALAALRDSGALTEAEFEAEKRRILES